MNHLQGLNVLILGLGDSGLAMARWCARCGVAGLHVADTRQAPPQAAVLREQLPQARLHTGALDPALLDGVNLLLKSPGLSPLDAELAPLLARADELGIPVRGELSLFASALADLKAERQYAPKLIAITGTNGKTTTTSLTAQLIERCGWRVGLAGNIGPTLLDTLGAALDLEPAPVAPAGADLAESPLAPDDADVLAEDLADLQALDEPGDPAPESDRVTHTQEAELAPEDAQHLDAVQAPVAEDDSPADIGGGPPPHLIPPAPPGPVFEHLPEAWVLELSSFQLDGVSNFEPSAATVLNLSQDHLDWHGSMEAYAQAKARIFGKTAVLVLNADDAQVLALVPAPVAGKGRFAKPVARETVMFGLQPPTRPGDFGLATEGGMAWLVRALPQEAGVKRKKGEVDELVVQRLMPADALRIRGRHNAANALAALALATAVGCPLAPMLHGLRDYTGEPHRVEFVATVHGVDAYDDSKGTNVGATVAAIKGLGEDRAPAKLVVILGGDGKGQDFSPLLAPVQGHARAVALIGRDAAVIEAALASSGVVQQRFDQLEQATRWAFERAREGDSVLLSPACASLDMFRNYAHRAQVFVDTVQALAADHGETLS